MEDSIKMMQESISIGFGFAVGVFLFWFILYSLTIWIPRKIHQYKIRLKDKEWLHKIMEGNRK